MRTIIRRVEDVELVELEYNGYDLHGLLDWSILAEVTWMNEVGRKEGYIERATIEV